MSHGAFATVKSCLITERIIYILICSTIRFFFLFKALEQNCRHRQTSSFVDISSVLLKVRLLVRSSVWTVNLTHLKCTQESFICNVLASQHVHTHKFWGGFRHIWVSISNAPTHVLSYIFVGDILIYRQFYIYIYIYNSIWLSLFHLVG